MQPDTDSRSPALKSVTVFELAHAEADRTGVTQYVVLRGDKVLAVSQPKNAEEIIGTVEPDPIEA
jgi:hypothetical protein